MKEKKEKMMKTEINIWLSVLKHKSALLESCSPLLGTKVYRMENVPINCRRKEKIGTMFRVAL